MVCALCGLTALTLQGDRRRFWLVLALLGARVKKRRKQSAPLASVDDEPGEGSCQRHDVSDAD
jgi:hypothetical protein